MEEYYILLESGQLKQYGLLSQGTRALFGVWTMAIQYLDYPMDSNGVEFPAMRERLGLRRMTTMGFGSSVLLATLVPILNWFVMPAAVAGATALWVAEYKDK